MVTNWDAHMCGCDYDNITFIMTCKIYRHTQTDNFEFQSHKNDKKK